MLYNENNDIREVVDLFAQRLKELRTKEAISQKALADKIGFSQQSIAKWEMDTATPSPDIISKLADIFDVSTDYLLGRTDMPRMRLDRLYELRREKGYTKDDIRGRFGFTIEEYNYYENGIKKPPFDFLEKLAELYEVSIDYLMGRSNEKTPANNGERDKYEQAVTEIMAGLTEEQKQQVIDYARLHEAAQQKNKEQQ